VTNEELVEWLSDTAARAITQAGPLVTGPLREYAAMLISVENALRAQWDADVG